MKPYITPLLVFLLTMIASCERVAFDADLPPSNPKVVIFSYISPQDDTIRARIVWSRPITEPGYSWEPNWISNAEVIIRRDDDSALTLLFDPNLKQYLAPHSNGFVRTGSTYTIEVTPSGKNTVKATAKVPPLNSNLHFTRLDSTVLDNSVRYRFRIEIVDPHGEPNYYRIIPLALVEAVWPGSEPEIYTYNVDITYGQELVSLGENDGDTVLIEGSVEIYQDGYYLQNRIIGFFVDLYSIDEHYYRFYDTYNRYEGDNPFSEPVVIYSNIDNGLGIFAAYNRFSMLYPEFLPADLLGVAPLIGIE